MRMLEMPLVACESAALISADRISRMGRKYLGPVRFDQTTACQLRKMQVGLFVEGFLKLETMLGRILPLANKPRSTQSLVVYASKESGASIHEMLVEEGLRAPCKKTPEQWEVGKLAFCSVEKLASWDYSRPAIDCVLLLDPSCMVYRARTMRFGDRPAHDRPQFIVDFLFDPRHDGSHPAFMLMTTKRASALPTETIARTFCQEAFWFLDGPTLRC